ncbi:aldo/keto reductase [Ramlibacter sp.]|uniref:aldo/keto reductase n=1 Tax=Ramlibacter sp. TaxID=1917967 RepID=UPI003D0FDD3C
MEYRRLGASGLMVPALSYGTGTFIPPGTPGRTGIEPDAARRIVDACIDTGITMFDTASTYGGGYSEEVLGAAIKGRRDKVIVSTKAGQPAGAGPNELGLSRANLTAAIERSLRRLGTDYIDVFQCHVHDPMTPVEETLSTLDGFVRAGKIRYIGVSNFSAWYLMKALAAAEKHHFTRYVVQQVYYSLIGRDYELELMPLARDQGLGAAVWSPLGWGRLTGKVRRGGVMPEATSRLHATWDLGPPVENEALFSAIDVLEQLAEETGKSISQIALNWLLQRPTVSTVIVGARNEAQLHENAGAVGWNLTAEQVARLDAASPVRPLYPNWFHEDFEFDRARDRSQPAPRDRRPIAGRSLPVEKP